MLSECKSSLLSIFQVTATNETNTNITVYLLTITLLVRNQITQTSQSKSVSNTRTIMPELRDDSKESPRKLDNQKHEWKLFKNYKKLKKLARKNSKKKTQEGYNMEIEVNRKEALRLNLEASCHSQTSHTIFNSSKKKLLAPL